MKQLLYIVLSILSISANTVLAQHAYDPNFLEKIVESERKHKKLDALSEIKLAPSDNYDIVSLRLFLSPHLLSPYLEGQARYTFHLTKNSSSIAFDLNDSMKVSTVLWHSLSLPFRQGENILTVNFPITLSPTFDSLEINFQGTPSSTGFGSYGFQKHGPDSALTIWTLSEPYGARDWYPCKMTLTDKMDSLDVQIKVPNGYIGVSNGLLQSISIADSAYKVFMWKHRYPITSYLVCFAVSNYDTLHSFAITQADSIPIVCYVYPENLSDWQSDIHNVSNIMVIFDSLFGPYPFAKEYYGQTQFAWAGGMEHQTNSFMYYLSFDLVAHELAHQWFGDKITCGSWRDIWLNEGFATYCTVLAYEHLAPIYIKPALDGNRLKATSIKTGSVYVDDTTEVKRIFSSQLSYAKGAYVLHMLRWEVGDSLFFETINQYQAAKKYNFTGTAELQKTAERISGKELSWFFEQWIFKSGYPTYTTLWSERNQLLRLKILQETSDPVSVSFFKMRVPIQVHRPNGDTIIVLNQQYSGQEFLVLVGDKVDSISFDPDLHLLSRDNRVFRLNDVADKNSIAIFPNPTSGEITLEYDASVFKNVSLKLVDANGKKVFTKDLEAGVFSQKISLDFLAKGNYTISLFSGADLMQATKLVRW